MKKTFNKFNILIGFIASVVTVIGFIMIYIPKSSSDLTGEWLMTSKIEKSDYKAYIGSSVQWTMFITECENKVKGTAEKIKINGIDLDYKQRTSLEFEGVIEKNRLVINYFENGKMRRTSGIINVILEKDKFSGQFSQTAASAGGSILGIKIK